MDIASLFFIAVGLSMDACAVSVCKGLCMHRLNIARGALIALTFGVFQAGMPVIGWALGTQFSEYITPIDHWIAFGLLVFIGAKMLYESFRNDEELTCPTDDTFDVKELIMLAIATSIDALAVGITFAFLEVDIVAAVSLIGVVTFVLSFVGVVVGNMFGAKFEKPATIIGGVVLILIGVKILLEHLGILSF